MRYSFVILAVALLAGCGSRGPTYVAHFARGVGVASGPEAMEKANRVLSLHQFEVEREDGPPTIYIESRWRDRNPFNDEQGLGIEAAQVRAIVRARPRSGTGMGELYTVDLTVEQRIRPMGATEWTHGTITTEARQYAARIAEDLKRLLDVGVHRF
jgi:hypothetical protein